MPHQDITLAPSGARPFWPLLYLAWEDDLLTPEEQSALHDTISSLEWLGGEEKKYLLGKLDPANPPARAQMQKWKRESTAAATDARSLADIATTLATNEGLDATTLPHLRQAVETLTGALGYIGDDAVYHFKSGRGTLTQQAGTNAHFDVAALTALLHGDQAALMERTQKLLCSAPLQEKRAEDMATYRQQVLGWCQILADEGLGAIAYPTEYGGQGDMASYFTVMETISYHDLSLTIKFGVQFGLWGMSVYFLGTEKHHRKYLKDIGTLALPGCFAMTETGHGSNVKGILTTATYNHADQTFTIHTPNEAARKEYIGNAALHGQAATVFASLVIDGQDYGVNAFVVPLRDKQQNTLPGITIKDCGPKMGLNGVDNGVIYFDNVVIPKENMLDRFASVNEAGEFESPIGSDNRRFFTMLGTLVGGRIGVPRSALAATKSGLAIAIKYAAGRKQFGPEGGAEVPILNYRMHQRRLMPWLAAAYAQHFALRYLTQRFADRTEADMREIEALAAGMKAYVTWNNTAALQECREACGGKGYLSENRIGALKNDTDVYTTFEGDNTVLSQLVAKSRLSEFAKSISGMGLAGGINYLAAQARTSITEKNPIIKRRTEEEHLLDAQFQLNAFKYREESLVRSAGMRLRRLTSEGLDSFDAANVAQHHLLEVAMAYIERVVLEQFILQIERTADEGCQQTLKKLCDLYALHTIEKHHAWYLEADYMEGVKTKAIRKMVNQLCWEIRQDAVPLVDAFDIPQELLDAPIAR